MPLRRALYLALFGLPAVAFADTRVVRVFDADRAMLDRAGITASVEDYGSYLWLELPEANLARLAASGLDFAVDEDARHIHLGEYRFDPLGPAPELAAPGATRDPAGRALRLLQFRGPMRAGWVRAGRARHRAAPVRPRQRGTRLGR